MHIRRAFGETIVHFLSHGVGKLSRSAPKSATQSIVTVLCLVALLGAFGVTPHPVQAETPQAGVSPNQTIRLPNATIFVFLDEDGNGEKGPDEPGIGGVTVNRLVDGTVVDSEITNDDGEAYFEELDVLEGQEYFISIEVPDGYVATTDNTSVEFDPEAGAIPAIDVGFAEETFELYSPVLDRG